MKNKKIIISIIIVFGILILAALCALYFLTDLFKTEQQLFYKYISKIEIIDSKFTEKFNEVNARILQNNSFSKTNIDFEMKMSDNNTGVNNAQELFSMESDAKKNISSKQDACDLKLIIGGQEFLNFHYLRDDNTYALKADNILTKYLAVENTNLKDLFSKLGVMDTSEVPDSIQINNNQISEEEIEDLQKHIKETYGTLIYNNIGKENFYKATTPDKETIIGLTLTNYDLTNLSKNILQTLNNDTKILNFVIDTIKEYSDTEEITVENLQSSIQELIKQLEENTVDLEEKEIIKVSLTKTKQSIVSKLNIELYAEQINGYDTVDGKMQPEYEKNTNKIEIDFSKSNEIIISVKENENEELKIVSNYLYDDNKIEFDIKFIPNNEEVSITTKYSISNYNSNNITTKVLFEVIAENMGYVLSVNDITTLNEEIQIPKLTSENSAKLNDMTSEELNQLFKSLADRISKLYTSNDDYLENESILNNDGTYEEAQDAQKDYEEAAKKEQELLDKMQSSINSDLNQYK